MFSYKIIVLVVRDLDLRHCHVYFPPLGTYEVRTAHNYYRFDCYSDRLNWFGARGSVVIKTQRYKPAGRGFDSRWCHWKFSLA